VGFLGEGCEEVKLDPANTDYLKLHPEEVRRLPIQIHVLMLPTKMLALIKED